MALDVGVSSHYSDEKETSGHKKSVNFALSTHEALGKPTTNDKSKAHAVSDVSILLIESVCSVRFN